uniref:50S ribosomal protein L2 n=1 Tax=Nephromyces sp. ex Molgula occidentalis TaxID=2544991 RepID=A0A5C1H7T2_9APIC|nr:50S ribosomal protein L2 [Nephromyces sp. ex Molgula occidentalis]
MIFKIKHKFKNLTINWIRSNGKNNYGKITSRFRGNDYKTKYKIINSNYANYGKDSNSALLISQYYDKYRTAYIGLIYYLEGLKSGTYNFILLIDKLIIGNIITFNSKLTYSKGSSKPIKYIILGSIISNIELIPKKGSQLVKASGVGAKLLSFDKNYALIKLPSQEFRLISNKCFATIGSIAFIKKFLYKKAGLNKILNKRSHVRGLAMNAWDHPHGGGEGRSGIGRKIHCTPWGKIKFKTRKKLKFSNKFIIIKRKV